MTQSPSADAVKRVSLQQLSFPRLLFALLRQRFTGIARLEQGDPSPGTRSIWFRGGMPVYTDWVSPHDVLGEVLMHRGIINAQTLNEGLVTMAKQGGKLGQLLLGQGAVEFSQLSDALRLQCTRKLLHPFALRAGEVEVEVLEHGLGNGDELSNQVNTLGLLRLGVGKHYDETRIQAEMGDAFRAVVVASDALGKYKQRFGYRIDDAHMLEALERGGTLADMTVPGVNALRLAQTMYVLWSCQMLLIGDAATSVIAERRARGSGQKGPASPPPTSSAGAAKRAPKPPPNPPRETHSNPPPTTPSSKGSSSESSATAATASSSTASSSKPAQDPAGPARAAEPKASPEPKPAASSGPRGKKKKAKKKAPPPPDPADGEFGERLHALEVKIAHEVNAFELFGLDLEAGRKEVRKVWAELSKDFHPDSLESRGLGHLHDRVEDVFASISEANGVLQNKEARENLKSAVQMGGTGQAGEDATTLVRNALEGEMIAREADRFLRANNFARALEQYEKSLELSATDPEVLSAVAWCRYQLAERSAPEGKKQLVELQKVTTESPMCARAHYYEGLIRNNLGDLVGARDAFKKALEVDSRMVEAERQLRAMRIKLKTEKQAAKGSEKKSALDSIKGLFGKK